MKPEDELEEKNLALFRGLLYGLPVSIGLGALLAWIWYSFFNK